MMPWARMHRDTANACCWAWACCAAVGLGCLDWHALSAFWNAAPLGSSPLPGPPCIWIAPCEFGSGKFGTPCERMHCEYASPAARCAGVKVGVPWFAVDAAVVGVDPEPATPGLAGLLEQAAAVTARPSSAAARGNT